MKRIAIYTNLHEACGVGAYGCDLATALSRWYEVARIEADGAANNLQACAMADVALLNWHAARVPLTAPKIKALRATGTRVILIHQNTSTHFERDLTVNDQNEILAAAEVVVTYEPLSCPFPTAYIPIGVPEISPLPAINQLVTVGTAGFPFPWKRHDAVVSAAEQLACRAHIIAPRYAGRDFEADYANWRERLGRRLDLWTDFEPVDAVVRQLARCWVNVFWFESRGSDDQLSQSGSCRLGVAALRPMIISRHRKFSTFAPYLESDFYVADTEADVARLAREICERIIADLPVKRPYTVFRDQRWSRVGQMFADLIEGLTQ